MNTLCFTLSNVQLGSAGSSGQRLRNVSLDISSGVTAMVGPSGAGKTSLMNVLAGYERPDRGTITRHPQAHQRLPVFWVPHRFGLWPHLTARQQLVALKTIDAKVTEELFSDFELTECADQFPWQLSQGEQSRLAVARAIASGAETLLMDEPLAHVDSRRHVRCWNALRSWTLRQKQALIFSTHLVDEVIRQAEAVICLQAGSVCYAGPVTTLYEAPASEQLAAFLGPFNWFPEEESRHWFTESGPKHPCVRPEQLAVRGASSSPILVLESRFAGSMEELELQHEPTHQQRRVVHRPPRGVLKAGDRVRLDLMLTLLGLTWIFSLAGCSSSATSEAAVPLPQPRYWMLPPEGAMLPAPRSIHAGPDDSRYVLDTAGRVLVFDQTGSLQRQWKMPDSAVGKPEGICVLKDGRIAVADTHYHRLVYFDAEGTVLGMQGREGRGPGEFIYPVALTQDETGHIYVGEYGSNDRIQKFTAQGKWLLSIGKFGTSAGEFQRPSGILWRAGKLFVVDAFNNRVQIFSDQGELLSDGKPGADFGGLNYPYGIAAHRDGELFVVEYGAGRVSQFNQEGKLLKRFGNPGKGDGGFATPWGIAVDSRKRVLVADTGNRRIVEFQP